MEANIHFPTDLSLLWDSGRKCLDILGQCHLKHDLPGWRKHKDWAKKMRIQLRKTSKVCWGGGKNKQERLESAVGAYLEISRELDHKVEQAKVDLEKGDLGIDFIELMITLFQIEYYQGMLQKHIDLVDRRLLQGEKIPHSEKVFSIFEDHVEWIKKGKSNNRVEIGHKVLIATDQYHFILSHQLVERQEDVALAVPLAQTLADQFGQIESLSFDRGFFSQTNK